MIPGLLIYLLTLAVDLITDYRIWAHKKIVNHIRGGLLRCIGLIPAVWLMGWYSIGLVFTYWLVFDLIFGTLIIRNPLFLGTTGYLDRLQHRYTWLVIVKFVLGVGGVVLIIFK